MASSAPRIITDVRLADFIQHVLGDETRVSTLIICAEKEKFVGDLLFACVEPSINTKDDQPPQLDTNEPVYVEPATSATHDLLRKPTLLRLARSRTVKLVFCHNITHLRAYLATLATPRPPPADIEPGESKEQHEHASNNRSRPQLAILNPIAIHRFTTAFSAQGFNRTFSLAVEAAHATKRQLLMVEFPASSQRCGSELVDANEYNSELEADPGPPVSNPWDKEVSILNVTTKSFGAGGRGWVGRTVTIRRIAERWCTFATLPRDGTDV